MVRIRWAVATSYALACAAAVLLLVAAFTNAWLRTSDVVSSTRFAFGLTGVCVESVGGKRECGSYLNLNKVQDVWQLPLDSLSTLEQVGTASAAMLVAAVLVVALALGCGGFASINGARMFSPLYTFTMIGCGVAGLVAIITPFLWWGMGPNSAQGVPGARVTLRFASASFHLSLVAGAMLLLALAIMRAYRWRTGARSANIERLRILDETAASPPRYA